MTRAPLERRVSRALGATLVVSCASAPSIARADEPHADSGEGATEIVVRAPQREVATTTTQVLGEKTLEKTGATNVEEALSTLPSVFAATDSRGERVLSLRGFSQRQVAVFVDGVPVLVPYDGQLDLAKMPLDLIDRISVVNGASATLYGPNGLGGAIDLEARAPRERPFVRVRTEDNAYTTRSSVVAGARAPSGGVAASVGGSFESERFFPLSGSFAPLPNQAPGRRTNSDRKDESVAGKATLDLGDAHRLVFVASRFDGTFGVPPGTKDFSVRYWRWTDWYASSLGVGHEYRGRALETQSMAYASFVGNTLDGYDDARYETQRLPRALHSVYDDTSVGGFARATFTPDLGVQNARNLRFRAWLGAKRDMHASFDNTNPGAVHVATNLLTASALAEVDAVPRRLRATAGAQVDGELPDKPPSGPSPDASAAVGPMGSLTLFASDALSVSASGALRTRFPTLRERFSTVFGTRDANPLLRPERALNVSLDVGIRAGKSLKFAVGAFDSELRDLITTVIVGPQRDELENVGRARFTGVEASATFAPARWFELALGGLAMSAKSGDALSDPVASVPSDKGLAMFTVRPLALFTDAAAAARAEDASRLSLTAIARAIGPQDFANPNTGVWERLDGYALADARVDWTILFDRARADRPILRSWLRVTNLFDANVEGRYSFPEPGRQVFVGLLGETP